MSELTWRRQWAPTLSACPWQPLLGNYFVKSILTDSKSVQVLITDCATFWSETISEQVMKQRIKVFKPYRRSSLFILGNINFFCYFLLSSSWYARDAIMRTAVCPSARVRYHGSLLTISKLRLSTLQTDRRTTVFYFCSINKEMIKLCLQGVFMFLLCWLALFHSILGRRLLTPKKV